MSLYNFSKNLKNLRLSNNLTQQKLAKDLNVSRQTISNYENETNEPDFYMIAKIAQYFNCSIDSLVFDGSNVDTNKLNKILDLNINILTPKKILKNLENNKKSLYKNINEIDEIINFIKNKYNCELSKELSINDKLNSIRLEPSKNNHLNSIDIDFYTKNNIIIFNAPKYKHLADNKFNDIPIIADISAGYPIYTTNDRKEFCFHIYSNNLDYNSDNYFALKINGDSMNKLYKDGDYILVEKTSYVKNGTPSIICIEDDYATFKIFSKDESYIYLDPCSTNPKQQKQTYPLNKYKYRIIGKVLGVINEYE
ncbi:XRE family transcriptional regulator [uncultured Tyzzerella sp.]|uniref:XRE family transcriptional regulator n=1 Tax=uncultured Tyzzerella sp. TaxID=2321398 RepID=UPI002941DFFA|nr:XRE family transcriptional regulator [uncultured Tyzzerella sp.]